MQIDVTGTLKENNYGGKAFKQKSEVGKAWIDLKVLPLSKPFVPFFLQKCRSA